MPNRRDAFGSVLGLAVFLGGIALLLVTFKLAHDMFSVPPEHVLKLGKDGALQVGLVSSTVLALLVRVLLLIVMALVSSLVAGRGVHMYTESRGKPVAQLERVEVRQVREEPEATP